MWWARLAKGGLRFGPHPVGRDYRSSVVTKGLFLIAIAENVFLSDMGYALGADCVLGSGAEVARGTGVLRWPRRAACLGGIGAAIAVYCV